MQRTLITSDGRPLRVSVEPWTAPTLSGAWANTGTGFNSAGFFVDPWGIVHLRGVVKTGAVGSAIFTLPKGYRPEATEKLATWCTSGVATVTVSTAGVVTEATGRGGTTDSITLDGLTFRAYQ